MPRPRRTAGSACGLTLLEMLIVVALLAISCFLAVPGFITLLENQRADALRMQLMSVLASARNTAITRRRYVEVCPSSDGVTCGAQWAHGWLLYVVESSKTPRRQPSVPILLVEQRPRSALQVHHDNSRPAFRFRPDGRSAGLNQTLSIWVGDRTTSKIVVSIPGRLRGHRVRTRWPLPCGMKEPKE